MHITVSFLVLLLFGAGAPAGQESEAISGYLVDMACALPISTHPEDIPDFGYTHDRECLMQTACARSGYAVLTVENRLLAFDRNGNVKAGELLRADDRAGGWKVTVHGVVRGDHVAVSAISLSR